MELERKLSSSLELPADMSLSPQWKFAPGNKTNQLQPAAQEPQKSALIGDWPAGHAAAAPLFAVGQVANKPVWEAGKPQGKVVDKRGVGAPPNAVVGGPGRWREDERDNPAQRNNERWGMTGEDTGAVKWGAVPEVPRISTHLAGGERWAAQVPVVDGAGRGRGRPEERWAPNRERESWALPGMGEPADASGHTKRPVAVERWGGEGTGTPEAGKNVIDRWRNPGAAPVVLPVAGPPEAAAATGAGRGRGFTVGRGRGLKVGAVPGAPGAPGPERWEGAGFQRLAADERYPGGPGGPEAGGGLRRYSLQALDHIRKQTVAAIGGQLPTPPAVFQCALDYPEILPGEPLPEVLASDIPVKRWQGTSMSRGASMHANGLEDDGAGRPLVPPQAFSYDQWLYKDPQGIIQGPFTKVDILEWQTAGFFPNDLPIKSAVDPDAPFIPLSAMIRMWDKIDHGAAPPGFAPTGLPALQQQQQHQQQHQHQQHQQQQQHQHQQQEAGMAGFHGAPQSHMPAQQLGRPSIIELLGKKLQDVPGPSDANSGFGSVQFLDASAGHHAPSDAAQVDGNVSRPVTSIVSQYDQIMDGQDASKGLFGVSPLGLTGALNPWGLGATPSAPQSIAFTNWLPPPTTAPPPPQNHAAPVMQQQRQQQQPVGQVGLFGGEHMLGRSPHVPADQQGGSSGWEFSPVPMPIADRTSFQGWGTPPTMQLSLAEQQQQQVQQQQLQQQQHLQQQHLQQQQQQHLDQQQQQHMQQQQQQHMQQQQQQHMQQLQQQQQQQGDNQFASPAIDHIAKLAQSMGVLGMQDLQLGPQAQPRQQQQQQHAWAAASVNPMLSGMKSLADIQQEQASEAARQAAASQMREQREQQEQAQSAATPEPPTPAAPAAPPIQKPDLSHLPGPLQQLFGAAQRASNSQQQQRLLLLQQALQQPELQAPASTNQQAEVSVKGKAPRGDFSGPRSYLAEQPVASPDLASASTEAAAKPEPKVAPWAAVTAKVPSAKTLREIQEEEAAQAAAETQRVSQEQWGSGVSAPSQVTTSASSGWAKVAAAGAAPAAPASNAWGAASTAAASRANMTKILQDEEQRPKASGRQAAAAALPVRGATLGEILERQLNPNPTPRAAAWGGAAAPTAKGGPLNMREIMMFEESAADLEGGDMDEDLSDLLPQQAMVQPMRAVPGGGAAPWAGAQPPAKTLKEIQEEEEAERLRQLQQQAQRSQPTPSAAKEEDMLWDYGGPPGPSAPSASAPPLPPASSRPPPGMFAAAAAKNMPVASTPVTLPKGAWLNAAGPATAAPKGGPAAPAGGRVNGAAAAPVNRPGAVAVRMVQPAQVQQQQQQQQLLSDLDGGPSIMFRDVPLSNEFQDWCRDQLKRLLSTEDLTMIEVLLSLDSRSEVAETCQVYMGNRPGVGGFVAEFLKRKDAELLRQQTGASKKKKGGNQGNPASAANVVKAGAKGKGK